MARAMTASICSGGASSVTVHAQGTVVLLGLHDPSRTSERRVGKLDRVVRADLVVGPQDAVDVLDMTDYPTCPEESNPFDSSSRASADLDGAGLGREAAYVERLTPVPDPQLVPRVVRVLIEQLARLVVAAGPGRTDAALAAVSVLILDDQPVSDSVDLRAGFCRPAWATRAIQRVSRARQAGDSRRCGCPTRPKRASRTSRRR